MKASGIQGMKLIKNHYWMAEKCYVAESFWTRLRGLIGRARLETGEGMYFPRVNSIHTWFMSFPIDVVFLTRKESAEGESLRISSLHENVQPWKPLPLSDWKASEVLELPSGTIGRSEAMIGDDICFV